jgi:hypothetical protein
VPSTSPIRGDANPNAAESMVKSEHSAWKSWSALQYTFLCLHLSHPWQKVQGRLHWFPQHAFPRAGCAHALQCVKDRVRVRVRGMGRGTVGLGLALGC